MSPRLFQEFGRHQRCAWPLYAGMTQTIEAAIDKESRSNFSIYSAIFRGQSILAPFPGISEHASGIQLPKDE